MFSVNDYQILKIQIDTLRKVIGIINHCADNMCQDDPVTGERDRWSVARAGGAYSVADRLKIELDKLEIEYNKS